MINLSILRHASTDADNKGITLGKLDWPLNHSGLESAKSFASELKKTGESFDLIISSPLLRAKQTADLIGAELSVSVAVNHLIAERDFGEMSGLSWSEFISKFPDLTKGNTPVFQSNLPSGESIPDVEKRVQNFIDFLLANFESKSILIVTHTGIIRILKRLIGNVSAKNSRSKNVQNLEITHLTLAKAISPC